MITWCYNLRPWVIQKTSVDVGCAACEYNMKINCANECKHGVVQLKGSKAVVLSDVSIMFVQKAHFSTNAKVKIFCGCIDSVFECSIIKDYAMV